MRIELGSGAQIETRVVSGLDLRRAQLRIPDPPVPKSYIRSRDTWEDNPMHPDYLAAQKRVAIQRAEIVGLELVRIGCTLLTPLPPDDGWLRRILRYGIAADLIASLDLSRQEDLRLLYLSVECLRGSQDMAQIVAATVITENEIKESLRLLGIVRNGEYIDEAQTRHSIETGIGSQAIGIGQYQIASPIDEYSACIEANMRWDDWRNGKYEKRFMVETMALSRVRKLIEMHSNDAQQTEAEKNSKKGK
jgi:hypothetical protein